MVLDNIIHASDYDYKIEYTEANWGDKDLEWIILDACDILKDDDTKWDRWGWPVFKGLHYIFSYNTLTTDVDTRGKDFIKYAMYYGWTVRNAWIRATQLSESGTKAAYMRADETGIADTYDDEVETLVSGLVSLLEPVMVVILGLIVGFIILALFLPLVHLINAVSSG